MTRLLSIRSPGGCISHQAFTQPFVSLNQFPRLIHQAPFSLFFSISVTQPREKKPQVGGKRTVGPSRSGRNASNFLLSRSLNVCALSLPPRRGINSLLHLRVPPSSRSLIHLISALRRGFSPRLPSESPPPVPRSWLAGWLAGSLACLLADWMAWMAGCSVFRGRCVSGSDCAGGREVNWKKLRCSHRRAEARGNKLDISPIHVGWRVYTISPAATVPHPSPSAPTILLPPSSYTATHTPTHTQQWSAGRAEAEQTRQRKLGRMLVAMQHLSELSRF